MACAGKPVSAKPTVSAPPLRSARRERRGFLTGTYMSASLHRRRHHRAHNPHMRPATAEIAVERRANVGFTRLLVCGQESGRAHDHTAGTVAALWHLLVNEGGLQWMRVVRRPEPFERDDRLALCIRDAGLAGAGGDAADQNGARPTLAESAAELRRR